MSVTVVGSVALDTVETPWGRSELGLGGAAVYFALAATHFTEVHLVGIVGDDFPEKHVELLRGRGINLDGLERVAGRTFRWSGRYHEDVNNRDTLDTQLNVFADFHPKVPTRAREAAFLFLGNIHPGLQLEVLEQTHHEFVALDTMNLWIDVSYDELRQVMGRVDCILINDGEAKQLTGEVNLVKAAHAVRAMGPHIVVVKKGEHGAVLFGERDQVFAVPAVALEHVVDPTGAGDSFAGGFLGYLAAQGTTDFATLKRAVVHGSVVASYTCEAFGPSRLAEIDVTQIEGRYGGFRELTAF